MRTAYEILISLTVSHKYFSDKGFNGFELIPDRKTNTLINDLRLLTKKSRNNWFLLFQTEGVFAVDPFVLVNKEFLFSLEIKDNFFYSVTDEAYQHGNNEMLFFNSTIDEQIVPEKRKVYPLRFNYSIHHSVRPVNITVTNAKGSELLNDTITDLTVKDREIDLTVNGENIYNISEDSVPAGSLTNERLFAKEVTGDNTFYGMVYFKIITADPMASKYQIDFEALT
jgi:hypothetical protein